MAQRSAPRDIERFEIGQTAMRDILAGDNRSGLKREALARGMSAFRIGSTRPALLDMRHPFSVLEHPGKGGGTFDFLQEPDIGIDVCDDIAHPLEIRLATRQTAAASVCDQMLDVPACDIQRLGTGQ